MLAWQKRKLRDRVFKRDKYRCQICGKYLKKSDVGKNLPESPTLDHIQPKAMRGRNGVKNLQTSCNLCNNRKGDDYHAGIQRWKR